MLSSTPFCDKPPGAPKAYAVEVIERGPEPQ
jgi:hypothetical protein